MGTVPLLSVFPVPTESIIVLAILAASPGASLLTRKSYKAGGQIPYSASIQLTLALVAVIITPLTLSIFYYVLEFDLGEIGLFDIAKQVLRVQFLPVILGLLMQKLLPEITNKYGKSLIFIANTLLILLNLVILPVAISLLIHLDIWSIVVILIMVIISLAIGHSLGGRTTSERSVLAVACFARNIGLTLFILTLHHNPTPYIPTLFSYIIISSIVGIFYARWNKKQIKSSSSSKTNLHPEK